MKNYIIPPIGHKTGLMIAGLLSTGLLGGALLFQYVGGLAPCSLCIWQRWPHFVVMVLAVIGLRDVKPAVVLWLIALTGIKRQEGNIFDGARGRKRGCRHHQHHREDEPSSHSCPDASRGCEPSRLGRKKPFVTLGKGMVRRHSEAHIAAVSAAALAVLLAAGTLVADHVADSRVLRELHIVQRVHHQPGLRVAVA